MSIEENKALLRQYNRDWSANMGDPAKIRAWADKYIGPDFIHHSLTRGDTNREQRLQSVLMLMPAMPDLNYTEDDMVAEGDKVVVVYTMRFTHKGPIMGIPPTGKQIAVKGIEIYRIKDGKIAETWEFGDNWGLMTQLGAIPSPTLKK